MKDKLQILIGEHKLAIDETREQLNEVTLIDTSKFGKKEKTEIETSILELELEFSLRRTFISDLEDLL